MAVYIGDSMPWHEGEQKMHQLTHIPLFENPSSPFLSPGAGYLLMHAPLLALGTLDDQKRPWTTVWGGDPGFARPIAESVVGVRATVDKEDPVLQALLEGRDDGEVVKTRGKGKIMAGLTIDLETRRRVKLAGRMMVGVVDGLDEEEEDDKTNGRVGEAQLVMKIEESLGNCPKYLNKKHIVPTTPNPVVLSDSPQLPPEALSLLEKADLFFISSAHGKKDMDTNHRGGPVGLVRLLSNDPSGAVLIYPEYSGNRLYQTLGNLQTNPLAGITVPDFDTGDVLYMTGHTDILVGEAAAKLLPRSNLAVKFTVTAARYVKEGLSLRGIAGEPSPYNPAVRYASTEKVAPGTALATQAGTSAVLVAKTQLTPTIARFRFRIREPAVSGPWKPGQYATFDFSNDLDAGYSHMRDDDPKSLNDDYLRTFTVSSPPSKQSLETGKADEEFEVTIRNVGKVTDYLFRKQVRSQFEVPLRGFEGEFRFEKKGPGGVLPFMAAGIGITPVLGQLESMDVSQLRLLWSIGLRDIGLVADTLEKYPQLVDATTLFITGEEADVDERERKLLKKVTESGVKVVRRRVEKRDIDRINEEHGVEEWYMCVGPGLKSSILNWLSGRRVVYEDFAY